MYEFADHEKTKNTTRTRTLNEFLHANMLYKNFSFSVQCQFLLLVQQKKWKTYSVDQLFSNLNEKMNFKKPYLKRRIS